MDQGNKKRLQFDTISTASETLLLSVKIIFCLLLVTIMEIMSVFPFTTLRIIESQGNGSVTLCFKILGTTLLLMEVFDWKKMNSVWTKNTSNLTWRFYSDSILLKINIT